METFELANLTISQPSYEQSLNFTRAKLFVVTEHGSKLWYIELDGIMDEALLRRFADSEEIGVDLRATTVGGRALAGRGYFHANPLHRAAAIRGEDQLEGYGRQSGA
ncbi:hypothetical protein [Cohnella yongneupensis]|uniref:Uncharacterized protein n=1 Tax=Cohnella yongneupensis TaxID=425006 RepID=A0ABW0QWW3_9BACL